MNRVGLTTSRFDRRVDQARISQRLRGSNFNYSGDVRGGNRTNSRMNYGDARISPQTGTRADSRVNRDNFGQVRTGDPGRAGRIAQRDIGQARSSPLGSSLRRSGDIGFRSGSSLRRNDLITPRNNYGRGGTFSQYGNTVAPGSRSRGDLGTPRADFGRSYRMGGMAGGNYNRGGSAGNIRSYSGGYSGGGPMIRSGGGGNFSRGSAASIRSGGGGGGFSRGSASIRSGGGGGGFSRGSAGVRGGGGGGSMHGGGGRGR